MDDVKKYWRSPEEYNGMNSKEPVNDKTGPKKEFPPEDLGPEVISDKPSRRDFLKLMGLLGYAALANSCEMRWKAIPYLSQPEEIRRVPFAFDIFDARCAAFWSRQRRAAGGR
jgi:MoCo/4Fe-4S cofactor protein with predicted Tat translocation signal